MKADEFEARKRDHIRFALDDSHQAQGLSRLDAIRLIHEALPELNFSEISLSQSCLGLKLATPFFIAGMTAGHRDAQQINRRLIQAAEARGWAIGVGSQRRDLEALEGLNEWRDFRSHHPKAVVFGNMGASQLLSSSVDSIRKLVDQIGAQALCIHLNALQEVIQPEGTPEFRGVLNKITELAKALSLPVVIKETGCGFSKSTLKRLKETGIRAVDVSGLGGTHWGRIEGSRAGDRSIAAAASKTFSEWGVSTVDSVLNAREGFGDSIEIWASGGVRSGLDAAKLLALGATRVGYAKPALAAAIDGEETLSEWMKLQEFELKTALFCTGAASVSQMVNRKDVWEFKKT